jgi:hypothetical protein
MGRYIIMGVCFTLGGVWMLGATELLSRTSETALVEGSWGLIAFSGAAFGALIGRRRALWQAFLFAGVFLTVTLVGLAAFFGGLWHAL